MPIIAKNFIKKEEDQKSPPQIKKEERYVPPKNGTVLLVNGKERKIGKKSQYLLDMLTLED
jgi:hypothetical protein